LYKNVTGLQFRSYCSTYKILCGALPLYPVTIFYKSAERDTLRDEPHNPQSPKLRADDSQQYR